MSGITYYQRKTEVTLNRANEYYRNNRDESKIEKINIENYLNKKRI